MQEELDLSPVMHLFLLLFAQWGVREKDSSLQRGSTRESFASNAFLLAMEPFHLLFRKAQQTDLLQNIGIAGDSFRVSLYANDVAVFV
jgi:hypothetical protein